MVGCESERGRDSGEDVAFCDRVFVTIVGLVGGVVNNDSLVRELSGEVGDFGRLVGAFDGEIYTSANACEK